MRFSLIPREMRFFDLFDQVAKLLSQASVKFVDMVTTFDDLPRRAQELKKDEDACDRLIEKTIKALDRSFITPFDREDIHTLATKLDDVMDNMEESAHRFEVFHVGRPTPEAIALAKIVRDCCVCLERAITELRNFSKPDEIQAQLLEIGRLENDADRIYRQVDSDLFNNAPCDPAGILNLIKWRELYSWLEETVDSVKRVAQVISEIVIKGT